MAVALFIAGAGCTFLSSNRNWRISGSANSRVLLVSDSPEVRHLIIGEDAREEEVSRFWREGHNKEERIEHVRDMMQHPDQYPAGRKGFLETMARMPGVYVPVRSYCNILEQSKSRCGVSPIETATYVLIQVTTGPSRGQQGWVCSNLVPGQWP
jgi:hypothetical protein